MIERIEWDAESAAHIRARSQRYRGAMDIATEWTQEVTADVYRTVDEPDPKSAHANSVRMVGYSPSADAVLTVVGLRDRDGLIRGSSAWKASGADLRRYEEGRDD